MTARPSIDTTARSLRGAENDNQDTCWSLVNDGWHGDPPPDDWADHDVNCENSDWQSASYFGLNGQLGLEVDCGASNFARRMIMAGGRWLRRHHRHGHGL